MADEQVPAKDIAAVFKRLKSLGENKMCFDCRASNPTWASITYGVFLCIDCSAVHRGLGVHLSFIRSIQLDTNWTWTQVRHMQVGGNAKANAFFKQHNLTTTDAKAKYNSRVANMYRERLASAVQKELQMNGTKLLHLDGHHGQNNPSTPEQKEVDFFERLEEEYDESNSPNTVRANKALDEDVNNGHIDVGHLAGSPPKKDSRMPTIGNRKPVNAKKKGLGAKKGGLGATKTSTNFGAIEAEAMNLDKSREQAENQRGDFASPAPPVDQPLSSALLYKTAAMKKEEEKLKNVDPKKAEQLERLGMGYGARSTFSHSVSDSMQSVEQVKPVRNSSQESFKDRGREASPSRGFFESYGSSDREGSGLTTEEPPRYDSSAFSMKSSWDEDLEGSRVMSKSNEKDDTSRSRAKKPAASEPSTSDEVQKKYGNAKAISSDQMFGSKDQHEMNRRLDQYSSSSGISSADLFGENKRAQSSSAVSVDYTAIKDSVQHVTGKLTNMASGVIGSLQSRYSGANR